MNPTSSPRDHFLAAEGERGGRGVGGGGGNNMER